MSERELEAVAIFGTHGVADALTTALAASVLGVGSEANPLMRSLLQAGFGWAVGSMLMAVGVVAIAWPTAADAVGAPRWVAAVLVGVGLVVALGNLAAVVVGWSA